MTIYARIAMLLVILLNINACATTGGRWEKAKSEDTIASYEIFLQENPRGIYADQARSRLLQLKENSDWQSTLSNGNVKSYVTFLNKYPNTRYLERTLVGIG